MRFLHPARSCGTIKPVLFFCEALIKTPQGADSSEGKNRPLWSNTLPEGNTGQFTMIQSKKPLAGGLGVRATGVCENFKAILLDMTDWRQWYLSRVRCKMWSCEHCAEINRSMWRAHIIDKINQIGTFDRWWFVTITAHRKAHKARNQEATLRNMQRGLKTLYDRLRRIIKAGTDKLEYCRVYEHHKTGKVHAHFIIRGMFTVQSETYDKKGNDEGLTRWLKDNAASCGLGYQASAKPIRSTIGVHAGFLAAYVTKYMTKASQGFAGFPKGVRRIQCSSGFGALEKPESQFEWAMSKPLIEADVIGRVVLDVNTGEQVTTDDFEEHTFYPNS